MERPGYWLDDSAPIVLDTSAIINLNATACAVAILSAFPDIIFVTENVLGELNQARGLRTTDADQTGSLIAQGLIRKCGLNDAALEFFEELSIGQAADTLGDGEASSIALALAIQGVAIVDEKKARRICLQRYPRLQVAFSTDIICHTKVELALGRPAMKMAVLQALQLARMSVTPDHLEWIIDLVGAMDLQPCTSLSKAARTRMVR